MRRYSPATIGERSVVGKEHRQRRSVRIFTDDFEKALEKVAMARLTCLNQPKITADGKPVVLQFDGYQQEQGSIWIYFLAKNVTTAKRIEVTNYLLYDYKTEQINMVHVLANGKEKTEKLNYPDRVLEFGF